LSVLLFAVILGFSGPAQSHRAAAPTPAAAVPNDQTPDPAPDPATARIFAQARVHFDAGTDHYAAGRYEDAIRSFQAGYSLVPRPNFLVNIGQAYRKLGDLVRAKEAYVAYVRALPENSAIRDQALQVLAEIEVQLHDGKPSPTRTELAPGWDQNPPAVRPPALVSPPPASPSSRTAAWLGLGFGGAGLALVATGVGFQMRAKSASDSLADASRQGQSFDASEERAGKRAEKIGNGMFFAGGAVMAAGLLIFLVVDAAAPAGSASGPAHIALSPDGVGVGWRF
jgi:tetratricopeptide (TPR) repeat protein